MMTLSDVELLLSDPLLQAVEEHLTDDPVRVALDKHLPHAALVATQVKYLQRARTKLPSYYAARCLLPSLAFEQASSEPTARYRSFEGNLCVDLTCGLGVDTAALASGFRRVVTVERDPVLARLAEVNFRRLGLTNITVVNASAEEFLDRNPDLRADLLYLDPDRRSAQGRKLVRLSDCSPDVSMLLPRLREVAPKVVVKLSPLFDVDEAFRVFGPQTAVTVLSLGGECKEVLVETGGHIAEPLIGAALSNPAGTPWSTVSYTYQGPGLAEEARSAGPSPLQTTDDRASVVPDAGVPLRDFRWLAVPDVALDKARVARRCFTELGASIASDSSFAFFRREPDMSLPGKVFEIVAVEPYAPKRMRKELRQHGIRRINLLRRDFPFSAAAIARDLGVAEGGGPFVAFTSRDGALWTLWLK